MLRIATTAALAALLAFVPSVSAVCAGAGAVCADVVDGPSGTYATASAFGGFVNADAGRHFGAFTGYSAHASGAGLAVNVESGDYVGNNYVLAQAVGLPAGNGAIVSVYRNLDNGFTCWGVAGQGGCQTILP